MNFIQLLYSTTLLKANDLPEKILSFQTNKAKTGCMNWILVAIGGALGSMARYGIFCVWNRTGQPGFWGTLIVNVIGCFAIGYLFAMATAKSSTDSFKLFWMVGFLGGLTTFSAFGLDMFQIIQNRSLLFTTSYFLFHGLVCILMVYLGHFIFQLR